MEIFHLLVETNCGLSYTVALGYFVPKKEEKMLYLR